MFKINLKWQSPEEWFEEQLVGWGKESLIENVCERVRALRMADLVALNPTFEEMRALEYVRDIGHGHYPHHNLHEVYTAIKFISKLDSTQG